MLARSYEHFWTQTTLGLAEFSDMPMARPPEEDTDLELFKSRHPTQYLVKISTIMTLPIDVCVTIVFSISNWTVRKIEGKWIICGPESEKAERASHSPKATVASGLTLAL